MSSLRFGAAIDAEGAPQPETWTDPRRDSAPFPERGSSRRSGHNGRGVDPLAPDQRPNGSFLVKACQLGDLSVAFLCLLLAFVLTNLGQMPRGVAEFLAMRVSLKSVALTLAVLQAWRLTFSAFRLYDRAALERGELSAWRLLPATSAAAAVVLCFPLTSESGAMRLEVVPAFWWGTTAGMLVLRRGLHWVARHPRLREAREVLVVGSGARALRVCHRLAADSTRRYHVIGFVDEDSETALPELRSEIVGRLDDLERVLMRQPVDEVLLALPMKSHYGDIERAIVECERAGVEATYFSDAFDCSLAKPKYYHAHAEEASAVTLSTVSDGWRLVVKRGIDILGSTALLLLLAPLLAVIAAAVKVGSPGPVLFEQERFGYRKRRFRMLKFRTMVDGADRLQAQLESRNEAQGPVFKIRADPRITPLGRFLRRTSLDELPQLWNVLRGEMSLVGPRPLPVRDVTRFSEAWLMRRFSVTPGITGLWQVSGRSNLGFDEWVALDLEYIDNWSLALDFRILLKTIPVTLMGVGAS
jgi:exopolysaccharide biosynthesis polyprenyl glycosylphosphotransferase